MVYHHQILKHINDNACVYWCQTRKKPHSYKFTCKLFSNTKTAYFSPIHVHCSYPRNRYMYECYQKQINSNKKQFDKNVCAALKHKTFLLDRNHM